MLGADPVLVPLAAMATWLPLSLFLLAFASEDLACLAAGAAVASGELAFAPAVLSCGLGILAGDVLLYGLGRGLANGATRFAFVRGLVPIAAAGVFRRAFATHGARLLFGARFLPGSRLPVYVAAGAVRYPLARFTALLLVAAAFWTPLVVGLAAAAGEIAKEHVDGGRAPLVWIVVSALVSGLLVLLLLRASTWRGRRLLRARWLRLSRFEYWPSWVTYAPVAACMVLDALRARRWFAFTACNPGIPLGGLALESKGDILDQMPRDERGRVIVAPYVRLRSSMPLGDRLATVAAMLADGKVVLKPDQGERGSGVAVVHEMAEAERWLQACPFDAIAQRWVSGEEYGVVWRRLPGGGSEIRSIAHKVLPFVVGDGARTLDELLLADDRTLPLYDLHARRHCDRLGEVPARGERVPLGDLGTHCRGATFVDARGLRTVALESALAEFLARSPGLDFGRFDLRVPDAASLQRGENVRVLEWNGVTGEPAHVYHPGLRWWRAMADLVAHWRAAAATGHANVAHGHRLATARELFALVRDVRRRPRFEAPLRPNDVDGLDVPRGFGTADGVPS